MQVGDLVKIIVPESMIGWPAGKTGLVLKTVPNGSLPDALGFVVIGVVRNQIIESVYAHCNEVETIKE
jgi:hypothetical protein